MTAALDLNTGAPRPSHPSGPTVPGGPTGPGRAEQLDDIDATLVGLLAIAYFGPAEQGTSESVRQACAAEVLLYRLRMARKAVADLRAALELPARLPMEARSPCGSAAAPGEPGSNHPSDSAGEGATPAPAVAIRSAVREANGAAGTALTAGADSGRAEEPRPDGSEPGDPQPPSAAPNVPVVRARDDGSADGAVGAATKTRTDRPVHYGPIGSFSTPKPPALTFAVGTADYARRS